jgi:hypothetical protein
MASAELLSSGDGKGLSILLANAGRVSDIGRGWLPIIVLALEKMSSIDPNYEVRQIKQKLGGLRLYYRAERYDRLREVVREAEILCEQTCEECGKPGCIDGTRGWLRILCEEHAQARADLQSGENSSLGLT